MHGHLCTWGPELPKSMNASLDASPGEGSLGLDLVMQYH